MKWAVGIEYLNMGIRIIKWAFGNLKTWKYGINMYQKSMKLIFGNMGSISIKKHEVEVW